MSNIAFPSGILLAILLGVGMDVLELGEMKFFGLRENIDTVDQMLRNILFDLLEFALVLVLAHRVAKFGVGRSLREFPGLGNLVFWVLIGSLPGLLTFFSTISMGYGEINDDFFSFNLLVVLNIAVQAPIREEILFRFVGYGSLRRKFRVGVAFFVSTLVFLSSHVWFDQLILAGRLNLELWRDIVPMILVSIIATYSYEKTRNIYLVAVSHASFNFCTVAGPLVGQLHYRFFLS